MGNAVEAMWSVIYMPLEQDCDKRAVAVKNKCLICVPVLLLQIFFFWSGWEGDTKQNSNPNINCSLNN